MISFKWALHMYESQNLIFQNKVGCVTCKYIEMIIQAVLYVHCKEY